MLIRIGGMKMRIALCDVDQRYVKSLAKLIEAWQNQQGYGDIYVYQYTLAEELLKDWEKGHAFDVLFLGVHFPYMLGSELAGKIRAADISTPIVLMTDRESTVQLSGSAGSCRYMKKPISPPELAECLDHCHHLSEIMEEHLFLRKKDAVVDVKHKDILFVEMGLIRFHVHTVRGQEHTVPTKLQFTKFLNQFPSQYFMRCHNMYLINMIHVRKFTQEQVFLGRNISIPIGASFRDSTLTRLGDYFRKEKHI